MILNFKFLNFSMGGCVVSDAASKGLIPSMTCIAVIDVVEGMFKSLNFMFVKNYFIYKLYLGSALEAISGMLGFLRTRPTEFKSIENAIQWSVKSSTIRNVESSRITVPSILIEEKSKQNDVTKYVWRTDLAASQPYWEGKYN
jgi:hypothetical protein